MSFLQRLKEAQAEQAQRQADPWRHTLEPLLRGVEAIGTNALLDLLGVRQTTGNARRLAATMRALGYVPLKSRRLMPGGFHTTLIRGWMLSYREGAIPSAGPLGTQPPTLNGDTAGRQYGGTVTPSR
jgi:hypothetical protein